MSMNSRIASGWRSFTSLILFASVLSALMTLPSQSDVATAQSNDLTTAVQVAVASGSGDAPDSVIVSVVVEAGNWAYGTAAIPAAGEGSQPSTRFFLAQFADGGWSVALRYTDAFNEMLGQAPATFPSPEIRADLDGVSLAGEGAAQLSFPFAVGDTWYFEGPHGYDVWDALDFSSNDFAGNHTPAPVLAMRGGTVYLPCAGMVMIDHGDGWTTGYYHVDPIIVAIGQVVTRGQQIGSTSRNFECGGYAAETHVHVWTEYRGVAMPIAGQDIGGWTVENGPGVYLGCLVKGSDRRCRLPDDPTWNNYVTNDGDIGSGGTATVDIAGAAGVVGDALDYQISAFPQNAAVTISWRRPGGSVVDLGAVTTNASGAFSGQIAIPETTQGSLNRVTFTSGASQRAVYVTVYPNLVVTPGVAAASGDSITLSVHGYEKKQVVAFSLAPLSGAEIQLGTATTSNTGNGARTVTLPSGIATGAASVLAQTGNLFSSHELQIIDGPTILAPTTGVRVGSPFTFSVFTFPASSPVTISLMHATDDTVIAALTTVPTNADGVATGDSAWPLVPNGQYRLHAEAGAVTADRLVRLNPTLAIPEIPAQRGTQVSATAHGFATSGQVTLIWQGDAGSITLGSASADANGSATILFTVPPAPDGVISLSATDAGGGSAYAQLQIDGGPLPGPASATLSPTRSTVNNWVTYAIANFLPNATVEIDWIRVSGGSIDLGTVPTDGAGAASGQVRIPATPSGMNQIRFTAGTINASAAFEVAPRIKVTPAVTGRGDAVDVSLRGYGKREVVRIRWKQNNGWSVVATVTTSNTGSANVSVPVPAWVPDGLTSVRGDGTTFRAQTNAVEIIGGTPFTPANETVTPSPTASATATARVTATVTVTPSPTESPTAEPTETATLTPTETETATPEPTIEPTETVTSEPTETVVPTETVTPTETPIEGEG